MLERGDQGGRQRRGKQREAEKDKAEIHGEGKTKCEKTKAERESWRDTQIKGRTTKKAENNIVKQHYKPLLFNAVLGPEASAPPEN